MSGLRFNLSAVATFCSIVGGFSVAGCGGSNSALPSVMSTVSADGIGTSKSFSRSTLAAAVGATAAIPGSYQATVLADSPLAYYQLNDSSSALIDSAGSPLAGTYGSNVVHQAHAITASSSSSSLFPGGTAYNPNGFASTAPATKLQTPTVTLEAWIMCSATNTTSRDMPIAVYGDESVGVRYGLYLHGLKTAFDSLLFIEHTTGQTNELRLYGSTQLAVGTAYHVVAVSDGTHVTLYVNGVADQSAAYPGAINYASHIVSGMQIGGDKLNAQYGSAPFPGTIAHVAVYGSALTPAKIVSHFLSGQLIPMTAEIAKRSDAIVDSIGINTHFDNYSTIYATQFPKVASLLESSGIRHIRVGMNMNNAGYMKQMQQLAAYGIRATYTTTPGLTESQVRAFPFMVYPSLEQFEEPNEPDEGDANWASEVAAFDKQLYSWLKSYPATAHYPILGPALAWPSSYPKLGDQSASMDYANIHDYLGAYNPGNPYAVYGGIKAVMTAGRISGGSHPMMSTETGYGTTSGSRTLDYRTDLRYMTRLFFEQFNAGLERSYSYELLDEGGPALFANFGLIQYNLTPKPAYTGIKSLISALQDPGPAFQTTALTYKVSGFIDSVHHMLMQKRNGTFVLALWLEEPSWNATTLADIAVGTQSVSLTTASHFSSITQSTMDENGNLSTAPLTATNNAAAFGLTDKVSLITLKP